MSGSNGKFDQVIDAHAQLGAYHPELIPIIQACIQPLSIADQGAVWAGLDKYKSQAGQQQQQDAGVKPRFKVYTAADALQPQPPVEWIVDGLISAGSLSLVVGAFGSKKTWAMLSLAVCVALGRPWLKFPTCQRNVLLVDEESGPRRLAHRLSDTFQGAHDTPNAATPISYISLARFDLLHNRDDGDVLADAITSCGAGLVIIDAFTDIMPGGDENSVRDTQPVMMSLRDVAERTGAAIIVIHHSGKNGVYRGSSALPGAADLVLSASSEQTSVIIDFSTVKARDIEPINFSARAVFDPGRFYMTSTDGSQTPANKFNKAEGYVVRYITEHGMATTDDIKANADVCSAESARRAIYDLAGRNVIRRCDKGGSGSKATYEICRESCDANL